MDAEKLKPCPFCGCTASKPDRFNIKCDGCGIEMNNLPHLIDEGWNRRAVDPLVGELAEALTESRECIQRFEHGEALAVIDEALSKAGAK